MKNCLFKVLLLSYYMRVANGLKKNVGMLFLLSILFALFISPVSATSINQQIEINGTANINTIYANDDVVMEQAVNIDGTVYLNITYVDGSTKLMELAKYIKENEAGWSDKGDSYSDSSVANLMVESAQYLLGKTSTSREAIEIGRELDRYFASDRDLSMGLNKLEYGLQQYHEIIQNNIYEIEAFYKTLEKTHPEIYCESRREVAKEYNLKSVKCGLHSKICHNGNLNKLEDGRDFCVHTDNNKDYLPCYNKRGMCGHIEDIKILKSEEDSYIPVILTFWNPGTMTLKPDLKVEIKKDYRTIKLFKEELGEVKGAERKTFKVFLDNKGIAPGDYTLLITVSSGRKDILDKFKFELLPDGTLERKGELSLNHSEPEIGKKMKIKVNYKNTGDYPYPAGIFAEVYLNDEKIDTLKTEKVFLKSGDTQNITFNYYIKDSGEYKFLIKVKNSNFKSIIDFNLDPIPVSPPVTGRFLRGLFALPINNILDFLGYQRGKS